LNFENAEILLAKCVQMHHHTKLSKSDNPFIFRCKDIAIFLFFKMAAAVYHTILDLFGAYLDHPVLDGLYRCAKYGCNWCSSFNNM